MLQLPVMNFFDSVTFYEMIRECSSCLLLSVLSRPDQTRGAHRESTVAERIFDACVLYMTWDTGLESFSRDSSADALRTHLR